MNRTMLSITAAMFLASFSSAYAQSAGPGDGMGMHPGMSGTMGGGKPGFDCSKAKEPEKCEEKRKEMRANVEEAKKACTGKQGDERRACMGDALCAKAPDPQKCHEREKEHIQRFQQMKQACGDKQGDELRACMREQRKNAKPAK